MIRYRFDLNQLIKWINWALLSIVGFLLLCILEIILETGITTGWRILPTKAGITAMLEFWAEYATLVKSFGCTLTLFIASYNLSKYVNVEKMNALSKLRELLNAENKKKIHYYLLPQDEGTILPDLDIPTVVRSELKFKMSDVEILDYLGTIELGAIMLKKGVISKKEFISQFGYRVRNLWADPDIRDYIQRDRAYYDDFLYAVRIMGL